MHRKGIVSGLCRKRLCSPLYLRIVFSRLQYSSGPMGSVDDAFRGETKRKKTNDDNAVVKQDTFKKLS